tara:strand:+ start:874 stop:1254 length:381 start_codon:yes stop_codon:yes gene_type:complete
MKSTIKLETSKIEPNKLLIKEFEKIKIGIFYDNEKFSVFEMTCPHMGGDLCSGNVNINKKEIQCMVHGYIFSIETGKFVKNPNIENTLLGREKNAYFDPEFRENYYFSLKMLNNKIEDKFLVINLP